MKKTEKITTQARGNVEFDDAAKYKEGMMPTKVKVSYGAAVDSVQLVYGENKSEKHGGNGGSCDEGVIGEGKYIKKIRATKGNFSGVNVLTALAFYDQDGKRIAGNERSGDTAEIVADENECICALCGETVKAGGTGIVSGIGGYTCELPNMQDLFGMFSNFSGKLKG